MNCPRCKSSRIQRDYDDAMIVARLAGLHRLLCNNCGLVFKGFDPLGRVRRAPAEEVSEQQSRRREPRYHAHLPAQISLIQGSIQDGKATYSEPSRGHCDTISKGGLGLSFVGTRFSEFDLTRRGQLLFVRVDLPEARIEAVTAIVNHSRTGEEPKRKWRIGVKIQQMSDEDAEHLKNYLDKRRRGLGIVITE